LIKLIQSGELQNGVYWIQVGMNQESLGEEEVYKLPACFQKPKDINRKEKDFASNNVAFTSSKHFFRNSYDSLLHSFRFESVQWLNW